MKKPLLDVIFASEKRKGALLSLKNGPTEIETLLNHLSTTRAALLPQIRILEEHYLVKQTDNAYELTGIGELIINEIIPLLNTVELFDEEIDYWGTHNIEFLPTQLLKNLKLLKECKLVKLSLPESYQLNQDTVKTSFESDSFFVITSFFHPNYPQVFTEMAQKGVKLNIIVTKHVLDIIQTGHNKIFAGLIQNHSLNLYVYPEEMGFQVIAFNDYLLLLRLLTNDGDIDIDHMVCSGTDALQWGEDIFKHYLKNSTQITEL
ncbi:helix-turn-helix transcriptional regulator [Methanolobus halotolerans]|uniref:Transcriptional regulator n=1 Tax=Methanolobus halotolerans TaxID=2052935 RepID=A0A4E0PVZ6_9EURY|nr:transcriptional regulator FilR1 domain-containing protein [Methanolobus halotolerans]TGC09434.1 transcriptional regulator [Methanolobus halotolerans]